MAAQLRVSLRGEDLGVFDMDDVSMDQAILFENKTGMALGELGTGLSKMSARSLQALVWLMKIRRGEMTADLYDNFRIGELAVEAVPDEDPTEADLSAELEKLSKTSATST